MSNEWWKTAVVYQVYPRSFKDSNGDGIGDLQGIISKLDYIKSLGVDAVWLNPIYKSPNDDGGYDISDYVSIQPEFGTMEDFDALLQGLHTRGLKLILDLVVNHSSDEHEWFTESRKSKDNPYRNFYFWKKGKADGPPNNWPSFFGGSAWEYDEQTSEYYLHLFSKKQADLNWENPELRKAIYTMMKFWLSKGVDGLRMDVISCISKQTDFPDTDTPDFNETIRKYYANGPRLSEFLEEMNQEVLRKFECMTVGEGPGITRENALRYLQPGKGLNMIFHFGHMFMDQGPGGRFDPIAWSMTDFKNVFAEWNKTFEQEGWGSVFLGNHDFPRMVSRWGNDKDYWKESAKLLYTTMLTMPGTPFIYQGDEIGMTNLSLTSISESKDIETITGWREAKKKGFSEVDFLNIANRQGRDNARTPFQWDATPAGGFSEGLPWMTVNPNTARINQESQEHDPDSILNYVREMISARKRNPVLVFGVYEAVHLSAERVFGFLRKRETENLLVLLNFSSDNTILELPFSLVKAKKVIGNYSTTSHTTMRPWEAVVYNLKAAYDR